MALLIERPIKRAIFAPGWIALDMRHRTEIICDEIAKIIGIIGGIHDDMTHTRQPFDQARRLRTIAPLSGRDGEPDRQAQGIYRRMELRGQATFGTADTGSFKPPF